jgi:hypothetical protein
MVRVVEESPQSGIQMCSPFCGKNVVAGIFGVGGRAGRYLAGGHTGNMGKKEGNSFGNRFFRVNETKKNTLSEYFDIK